MNIRLGNKEYNISKKEILMMLIIIILVVAIILVNTNKEKKLECVKTSSNITIDDTEKVTATFKNGKLSILKFNYKTTLKPDYQYALNDLYNTIENQLINLKSAGGYDYTINKGADFISYNSTIDINAIPDESKMTIGYNSDWTYKDVKADLERKEFKCN